MSTAEILDAALALNARQRGRLIAKLIESLDAGSEAPFENADEGELVRRLDGLETRPRRSAAAVSHAALERLNKRRR